MGVSSTASGEVCNGKRVVWLLMHDFVDIEIMRRLKMRKVSLINLLDNSAQKVGKVNCLIDNLDRQQIL
ncbi:hypothetical protein ATN88_07430 [Enterovibrio coralii]|uniref:Uncharacterized protein n=1 Tax=Enterovibrio coralii TaxID=294935 RepID=A0A135I4Z1_9GAMM|nr:hypothetical protein ATN88_07430 [Enterovibrio coralii]